MNLFTIALACLVASTTAFAAPATAPSDPDLAAMVQPIPPSAVFAEPGFDVWCGTMVRGDDGKCHLFYSRWPKELSHQAWVTSSEIAHAVADQPFGPYRPAG